MSRPIYHHKVSRYWLNYFANNSNKVSVYDKLSGKIFWSSTTKVGGENNYYDIRTDEKRDIVEIEKRLAELEGDFSRLHRTIIENKIIEACDKDLLIHLLVLQHLKVDIDVDDDELKLMAKHFDIAFKYTREKLPNISSFWEAMSHTTRKKGNDGLRDAKMDHFIESHGFVYSIIKDHIYKNGQIFLLKTHNKKLIISDKPVLLAFNVFNADGGSGFLSKSMICIAPISEKLLILMTTDDLMMKIVHDCNSVLSDDCIDSLNKCQFAYCERQVYSSDESIFTSLKFKQSNYQAKQLWWKSGVNHDFLVFPIIHN